MKKFLLIFFALLTTLSLSSCKKTQNEDPQTILNKAWEKQIEKQEEFQKGAISLEGKAGLEISDSNVNIEGSGKLQFDTSKKDQQKAALNANLKANGKIEGKISNVVFKGELRWLEKNMYLFFDDLSLTTDDPQVNLTANLVANMYKSQWIEFPFDIFDRATSTLYYPKPEINKTLLEIAKKNNFFDVKKDLGNRSIEIAINSEKLNTYINEISKAQDTTLPAEYGIGLKKFIQQTPYSLQVTINDDYDITAAKLNVNATDPAKNQSLSIDFDWKSSGKQSSGKGIITVTGETPGKLSGEFTSTWSEKAENIEVPKDAKPFALGALLPGLAPSD